MGEPPREDPDFATQFDDAAGGAADAGGGGDPLYTGVDALCESAVERTGVDGAAVAVLTRSARIRELAYATDPLAQRLDELQYVIGEGPCLDAYLDDSPQHYPELYRMTQTSRWPTFAMEAAQLGVGALFAFPVPDGRQPMGILELYRRTAGGLDPGESESAQMCAVAIAHTMQSNWDTYVARAGNAQRAIDLSAITAAARSEPADPFTRTQIHVAAGMVALQLAVSTAEGIDRLRAYSYASGRSLSTIAADIIARRLSLRDQHGD
jgi:hypothetical protein